MRAVGGAMLIWSFFQGAGQPPALAQTIDVSTVPTISRSTLEALLVPDFIDAIPELDPWGNPYEYRLDSAWSGGPDSFGGARSAGADGVFAGTVYAVGDNVTPSEDLVRWDGELVRRLGPPFVPRTDAQARTAQEMTVVLEGIWQWLFVQTGQPPLARRPPGTVDLGLYQPISAADLRVLLAPHLPRVPDLDPFGQPFDYYLDIVPPYEEPLVAVRSRGRDGVAEGDVYPIGTFPEGDLDRDMVHADLIEVQFPDSFDSLIFVDDFESGDSRFWSAWSP